MTSTRIKQPMDNDDEGEKKLYVNIIDNLHVIVDYRIRWSGNEW